MEIDNGVNEMEQDISRVITNGFNIISKVVPQIRQLISPIIDSAYKIQIAKGKDVLEDVATSSSGCWNSFLYVNGRTDEMHTEMDCAYTFITVPKQVIDHIQHCTHQSRFMFQIKEEQRLFLLISIFL